MEQELVNLLLEQMVIEVCLEMHCNFRLGRVCNHANCICDDDHWGTLVETKEETEEPVQGQSKQSPVVENGGGKSRSHGSSKKLTSTSSSSSSSSSSGHLVAPYPAPSVKVTRVFGGTGKTGDCRDLFGQNLINVTGDSITCVNCRRSVFSSRFASHLEKCMGMGRNSSRIASRRLANYADLANGTTTTTTSSSSSSNAAVGGGNGGGGGGGDPFDPEMDLFTGPMVSTRDHASMVNMLMAGDLSNIENSGVNHHGDHRQGYDHSDNEDRDETFSLRSNRNRRSVTQIFGPSASSSSSLSDPSSSRVVRKTKGRPRKYPPRELIESIKAQKGEKLRLLLDTCCCFVFPHSGDLCMNPRDRCDEHSEKQREHIREQLIGRKSSLEEDGPPAPSSSRRRSGSRSGNSHHKSAAYANNSEAYIDIEGDDDNEEEEDE